MPPSWLHCNTFSTITLQCSLHHTLHRSLHDPIFFPLVCCVLLQRSLQKHTASSLLLSHGNAPSTIALQCSPHNHNAGSLHSIQLRGSLEKHTSMPPLTHPPPRGGPTFPINMLTPQPHCNAPSRNTQQALLLQTGELRGPLCHDAGAEEFQNS